MGEQAAQAANTSQSSSSWTTFLNPTPSNPPPKFTFSFDPSLQPFSIPMKSYLDAHPGFDALGTGALVFHHPSSGPPLILILKRAAHDSMPGRWETPGGGCDFDDETILHGAARELWEEAGLVTTRVKRRVGGDHVFFSRSGRRICKVYFEVEIEGGKEGEGDGEGEGWMPEVKIDTNEHEAFLWVSEEEVRAGRKGETEVVFTTREQREAILQGFEGFRDGRDGS